MTTQQGITEQQSATIREAAQQFAQSEVMGDNAVKMTATILGTAPTYTLWELVRSQFITAYMPARKCNESAADAAWGRMAKRMKADYGLEKPKAPSKAAGKKADQRAKKEKEAKLAVKKYKGDVAALRRAAGEALEQGKAHEHLTMAIKIAEKAIDKAAEDAQKARWEKLLDRIREAKKSHDARILAAIEKAIETLVPVKAGK